MLVRDPLKRPTAQVLLKDIKRALATAGVTDMRRVIRKFLGAELDENTRIFDSATRVQRTSVTRVAPRADGTQVSTRIAQAPRPIPRADASDATARKPFPVMQVAVASMVTVAAGATVLLAWRHSNPPAPPTPVAVMALAPLVEPALPAPPTEIVPIVPAEQVIEPDAPVIKPAAKTPAVLHFFSKPWAKVTIDGEVVGTTPVFQTTELKAGKHTFVFENPAFRPKTVTLELRAGESRDVRVQLEK